MIIDSHLHLARGSEESFEEAAKRLLGELERQQIAKAFVIADNIPDSDTADIGVLLRVFAGCPQIYLLGAPNPFADIEGEVRKLDELIVRKQIIGLKLFCGHDKIYLDDERLSPFFTLAEKRGLPLVTHTGAQSADDFAVMQYNDPKFLRARAAEFPDLKMVIAHYFWPKLDYCFEVTRGLPNIYFDTSALAHDTVIETSGGIEKIRAALEKTALRNPESVLFGTDYPAGKFEAHIALINSLNLPQEMKSKIFSENAEKLFAL